ncbi:MAG: hypothetical protein QXU81_08425 [Candidatus Bathyarchaeia archaeon]
MTTDYYSLYPYATRSIDFGLSKFGEMINYPVAEGVGVGLQYPGYDWAGTYNQKLTTARDPFANEYISPALWLNGWFIEIRYTHRTLRDRYVVAMAMFADMISYGGDWLVGHPLPLEIAPHGGRKINTYAETEDLMVVYYGPRLFVAESLTHIYDWFDSDNDGKVDHPDETWPIVDVKLKFVFNKDKKYVIIFKDIKQVISGKELDSPLDIQFSNREEWDLGPPPNYASYAHFYHQNFTTCYGPDWHVAPGIMRENKVSGYALSSVPTNVKAADGTVWVGPIADGSVRVYVEGAWCEPGRDYDIDLTTGEITWKIPVADKWVEVVYKLWKEGTMDVGVPHLYDVAQIISSDKKFVGFKAFWPVLSDYTVDGWALSFRPLIFVSEPDMVPICSEPDIPMVIGEWDFMLGKGYPEQFRGVEVVGLTDYHDAKDTHFAGVNALDREVQYQLDEVFNPWDLNDAVEKETERWVKFIYGPKNASYVERLREPLVDSPWDAYCSFAERVILLPDGKLWKRGTDYKLIDDDKDGMLDSIHLLKDVPSGKKLKVLYSTYGAPRGRYEWIIVGRDSAAVDSAAAAMISEAFDSKKRIEVLKSGLDMQDTVWGPYVPYMMSWLRTNVGDEPDKIEVRPGVFQPSRAHYRDAKFGPCSGRSALRDDWCTRIPISSSNIITVGSPWANHLTEYFNEFTAAYLDVGTGASIYPGYIVSLSCWSQNTYMPTWDEAGNQLTGYAVIATYKDLNGTVGLVIWGWTGQDTFFASEWFWDEGIEQLQGAPECATAIVLKIDYTKHPPRISIVEVLGTISETLWVHVWDQIIIEYKGGIHVDP